MNSSEYQNAHEKNLPHGYFLHKGNAKLFFICGRSKSECALLICGRWNREVLFALFFLK